MTFPTLDLRHPRARIAFGLLLAGAIAYLATRNIGIHPIIFADEWYYSKMARLMPLAEALVPSYLYLWLFSASTACGPDFLECVRAGNLLFYAGAAPFLYLTARRYLDGAWPAAIALLSLLAPLNIYTVFFMPEATYYFGFCVLSWAMLAHPDRPLLRQGLAGGAILGLMSLVKVHALFILPALCLYLVYASWHAHGAWFLRAMVAAAVAVALTFAIKFGLGYLLAGDAALSILGSFYGGASSAGSGRSLASLLAPGFVSFRGHLMALAMLLGLPLAILLLGVCTQVVRKRGEPGNPLLVYTFLMLGAAAGMTVVYAATVAHVGNNEGLRLHMRYYSFTFPLLWIVAALAMRRDPGGPQWLRWTLAATLAAVLAFAFVKLRTYVIIAIDAPDLAALRADSRIGAAALAAPLALQLALLALWAVRGQRAARLFMLVFLPLSLLIGQLGVASFLDAYRAPSVGDRAGKLVRQMVPPGERGLVTVANVDMQQIMRAQFHIDNPDTRIMQMDGHVPLEEYNLPLDQRWLLVMGPHALPASADVAYRDPEFVLLRLPPPSAEVARIRLSQPDDPAVVESFEGLSGAEPWGRWSDGERVTLRFTRPLPRKVGVMLSGHAFGDNATLPFRMRIGSVEKEFRLGAGVQAISLRFDTDGAQRAIEITVPHPVSPAALGQGVDTRRLGIALGEVVVTSGE